MRGRNLTFAVTATVTMALAVLQATPALAIETPGQAETGDRAGNTVATGDFNGDGFDDLAIGAPFEIIGATLTEAGAVTVVHGSANGLTTTGGQLWTQDTDEIAGTAEAGDQFGFALAAGDFNGNGRDDLAVGSPFDSVSGKDDAGLVNVIYGTSTGLEMPGNELWQQNVDGIEGESEGSDHFGYSLAAADFGRTFHDDLAIGVPDEDVGDRNDAGSVNILYGTSSGLSASGNKLWHQDLEGVEGGVESFDDFGQSLAAGDFGRTTHADLAIGVPGEALGDKGNAGVVNVLYGSADGLTEARDEMWHQDVTGITPDGAQAGDNFGYAMAAGDFSDGNRADLAIGVPLEDLGTISNAGAVTVIYGAADGLTNTDDQFWTQGIL